MPTKHQWHEFCFCRALTILFAVRKKIFEAISTLKRSSFFVDGVGKSFLLSSATPSLIPLQAL